MFEKPARVFFLRQRST